MAILELREVGVAFGGLQAVNGVNLTLEQGERRALVGPNGAGKSTLFGVIAGERQPTAGQVLFRGHDVTRLGPHERARMGMSRVFQRTNLIMQQTVTENVRLAVLGRHGLGLRIWRPAGSFEAVESEVAELLGQLGLESVADTPVTLLSYGEQRQVEMAMALALRPQLLLLDEPTAGMSPAETDLVVELLRKLPRELTVVIVEHDMDVVAALADTVTVLYFGEVLTSGPVEQVRSDPKVLEVYLGMDKGRKPNAHSQ